MKLQVLGSFLALFTATALAQTSTPSTQQPTAAPTGTASQQMITMTGCVGGGSNAQPYVLSNPVVLPQTGAATGSAAVPSAVPPTAATGTPGAMPPSATPGAVPPSATPAAVPPSTTPGSTGAAGTAGTGAAGAAGTAGTAGAPGATGAAGATGSVAGAPGSTGAAGTPGVPPAGTAGTMPATGAAGAAAGTAGSTSALNGYRLSGTDMSSWAGQRVQIAGTVIPPTGAATATPGATPMPEFRVQSVQPVAGPCPQQ
jgi:pilus assembly protein FimV